MSKIKQKAFRVLAIALVVAAAVFFHKTGLLQVPLQWIENSGFWGPYVFLAVYVLSCVFFIPSLIFTFSSGVLFGFWKGMGLSLLGLGIGSMTAFWIGRYLAHEFVEKKFSHLEDFQRIASAVEKKGWKMIVIARLSPVFPFSIGNYGFGVTRIPSRHYFLASLLGSTPSTAIYTYWGTVTGGFAFEIAGRSKTFGDGILLLLGLIATLVLAWYVRRITHAERNEMEPPSEIS